MNGSNDPLLEYQWHLYNTGQAVFADIRPTPGVDLNMGDLFTQGVTGKGVTVGIDDVGRVLTSHEDLVSNLVWQDPVDALQDERGTTHATTVAAIIGALANNGKGGRGVAPQVQILDLNAIAPAQRDSTALPRVINHSVGGGALEFLSLPFGEEDFAGLRDPQTPLSVKAAGNSYIGPVLDNGADLCAARTQGSGVSCVLANTDFIVPVQVAEVVVGAVNGSGKRASYSQSGSTLWVMAPGGERGWESRYVTQAGAVPESAQRQPEPYFGPGIVTADAPGCSAGLNKVGTQRNGLDLGGASSLDPSCNYTALASGTSAAAPMVTGVIALMLQVNPSLSWRDIKYILAATARQVDPAQAPVVWNGVTLDAGWTRNAGGHMFSNWYGFGLVDASRAVNMARKFSGLPSLEFGTWAAYSGGPVAIPYRYETAGMSTVEVTQDLAIETVLLHVKTTVKDPNGLRIVLTSPSGTRSIVVPALTALLPTPDGFVINLTASNAFLDESSKGSWKLQVMDVMDPASLVRAAVTSWGIRVVGHQPA
ncbi:S8 family serine peptidase [Cupriavidus necator]